MAEALVVGALVGDLVSKSSTLIIDVIKKTWYFKSQLKEMQKNVENLMPKAKKLDELNKKLDRPKEETEGFINLLERTDKLVLKCANIKFNLWQRYRQASKLADLNKSIFKFIQFDLPVQTAGDVMEILTTVKDGLEKGGSSGLSTRVPLEKAVVIGFEDRVRDLKAMVLKDSPNDDCSVVVVSAAGGCGKTTLVNMLCHDLQMKGKFKTNIYYATIPEQYDIKVIIKNLLGRNQPCDFDSDEVAIQQWGSFLGENNSEILLVLDDVRSESIITALKFKSPTYKILVTSRESFKQFKTYQLAVLNDQHATRLFRHSSFSEDENEHSKIPDDLVDKLVKCCKNHPLALSVIGGSLKGRPVSSWILMHKKLSTGNKSFSSFHKSIRECLEKSFYLFEEEPEIKLCYQDLGLFPEDQKIAASTLMDIWVHLYNHDEEGLTTMDILTTLSSRNLATLLPLRKHLPAIANHSEEESVMQHDMMRELAIHLSSKEPLEHRERLIINSNGKDLNQLQQTVNARILSISTDERCPLTWNEIQAPNVEVFVLNYMSKIHPLPQFMHNINNLKMTNGNSMKDMTSKFNKLDKFEGYDFRRWQKKMHFLLTILKVVYVLSTPIPEILEDGNLEQIRKRSKWENDNYICLGHILNGMCDALFDVYQNVETAKLLWDTLEAKYMAEDSSSKKFLVSNFVNYKMIDSRPVMEQYNELLRIIGQFTQHDMKSIQVSSIIDKLPHSWIDCKHNLKHQKGDLTLVELGSHFKVEESLRGFEKVWVNDDKKPAGPSSVNMVEGGGSFKNNQKFKGKRKFQGKDNKGSNKKQVMTCWKCGKAGHFKKDCRVGKNNHEAGPSGSKDPNKQQG